MYALRNRNLKGKTVMVLVRQYHSDYDLATKKLRKS